MRRHSRTSPLVTYRPDPRAGRPVVICDTDREEHGATCAERYAYQALAVASALVRADVEDELTRRQNAPRRR